MKFDFDCLPFILIIFAISEIIENKVISNIKNNISEQTKITKQTKVIVKNNKIEKLVWQNDLKQGEIFYLKNGQQLTVDSKLISENGVFDTSAISGESKPYIANKNDEVLSGSINNGQIQKLQVINIHENSLVANLDKELQKLQAKETPMFILGQKFLQAILITIIVVAILNFSISLPLFGIQHAILTSIAIILITCPCGIAAGLPLLFSIYMSELLKNKILVRDLLFIEYVQKIKAFAFDKTGTITTSTPDVYEIKGETKYNKYIYGIEKFSTHPIAKSICNYLKSYESSNLEFTKIEEKVGKGIEAKIEDKIFNIGSKKYLDQLQIEITSSTEDQNLAKKGFIIIYVVCNKKITNKIILNSKLIPGVKNLMQNLNTIGKTYLITGDNSEVGEYIAKKANIWKTYSNVTPMEKLNVIKKIQQDSLVLYTGDGINDSLSLRQANLSISFSNGSDVAKQNANALLLKQDISLIWKLLNFSKKTVNNMYLSMWITYIYNLITMLLAILSVVSLEFAPFAEVVSVFIIIVNVYRLKLSSNKVFSKN